MSNYPAESLTLRAMTADDIPHVLAIIADHDEDDAEAAQATYQQGLDGYFVAEIGGNLAGTTGYRVDDWTDNSYWLSWTYLAESYQGKKLGKAMLGQLLSLIGQAGACKLFVSLSDYQCPDEGDIYLAARKCYESLGFQREILLPEYYDAGENKLIYSLRNDGATANAPPAFPKALAFEGIFEIDETEDCYAVHWQPSKKWGVKGVSIPELEKAIRAASEEEARLLYLTLPEPLAKASQKALEHSGFSFIGTLEDYYAEGVAEYHFATRF